MNDIKTIKNLISIDDQYDIIDKIVNEEFKNLKLTDEVTKKFKDKNLSIRLIPALFGGDKQWSDFSEIEQIAFIEGAKKGLDWEILNTEKWFSNKSLIDYDSRTVEIKQIDSMFFKNIRKIDNNNYLGYEKLKTIYEWFNNTMLIYNYDSQREPIYMSIGTKGRIVKTYSVNSKAIIEIKKSMIEGTYEEDLLIYNVLIQNQKNIPQVSETQKFEDIYDLEVKPNYDRKSINYTVVNPLDGWHRTLAGVMAYEECLKKGIELDKGFPIKLTIGDIKRAQRIVNQIFKRTDTSPSWLSTIDNSDYNDFVNAIESQSKLLKGKLSKTYDEYLAKNSLTYLSILADAVKNCATDIPLDVKVQRWSVAGNIANIIDELFEFFEMKYGNMKNIIDKTHLADVNIFIGYIAIANSIREIEDYTTLIIKIGEKVCSLTNEELEPLKLINRSVSVKHVYNYFEKIAKEVISNEE
jgi:hypothetical protein